MTWPTWSKWRAITDPCPWCIAESAEPCVDMWTGQTLVGFHNAEGVDEFLRATLASLGWGRKYKAMPEHAYTDENWE